MYVYRRHGQKQLQSVSQQSSSEARADFQGREIPPLDVTEALASAVAGYHLWQCVTRAPPSSWSSSFSAPSYLWPLQRNPRNGSRCPVIRLSGRWLLLAMHWLQLTWSKCRKRGGSGVLYAVFVSLIMLISAVRQSVEFWKGMEGSCSAFLVYLLVFEPESCGLPQSFAFSSVQDPRPTGCRSLLLSWCWDNLSSSSCRECADSHSTGWVLRDVPWLQLICLQSGIDHKCSRCGPVVWCPVDKRWGWHLCSLSHSRKLY